MRIIYLTAGAAGMYCGSCLHDNSLAKALIAEGHDTLLVPIYTPIKTDEGDVSEQQLFYGGLNVYLQQLSPIFRWVPNWADQLLNSPKLVNWVASRGMETSAKKLGAMTVSMLRGAKGHQRKEVRRLTKWLVEHSPDVIVFSNLLIAGCIDELRKQLQSKIVVVLQGDDIFYDGLVEPYRSQALKELRRLVKQLDGFVVHSEDYGRRMSELLDIEQDRIHVSPLSIDTSDFTALNQASAPEASNSGVQTVGYLARLAPEKGLHLLVEAFIRLAREPGQEQTRLAIAGWLGGANHDYWKEQQTMLEAAGLGDRFRYHGEVDRQGKLDFLNEIDLLCVPTTYAEPKGLFVLEGLAAGVPYLQPSHGSFPEMHSRANAGELFEAGNVDALHDSLKSMLSNQERLLELGRRGQTHVFEEGDTKSEARRLLGIFDSI